MPRKLSDLLIERLRENGLEIPEGAVVHRTYASASSRNLGAWSWFLTDSAGSELHVGSRETVRDLVSADRLYVFADRDPMSHYTQDTQVCSDPGGN